MNHRSQTIALMLVFAAFGCGSGDPAVLDNDNRTHGDCRIVWVNAEWTFSQLALYHNDPRSCPDSVDPGELVTAGGRIEELDAVFPSSNIETRELFLYIHNTGNGCQELGSELASSQQTMLWADFDHDGVKDWTAGLWISYVAGTWDPNRDCPVFEVTKLNNAPPAIAWTVVDYTKDDQ